MSKIQLLKISQMIVIACCHCVFFMVFVAATDEVVGLGDQFLESALEETFQVLEKLPVAFEA